MAAKTEEYKRVGEAVTMFESFQRSLKVQCDNTQLRSQVKVKAIPRAEPKPLLEELLIERGLLRVREYKIRMEADKK